MNPTLSDAEIEALMAAHGLPEGKVVVRFDNRGVPLARCLEVKRGLRHKIVSLLPELPINMPTALAAIDRLRRDLSR